MTNSIARQRGRVQGAAWKRRRLQASPRSRVSPKRTARAAQTRDPVDSVTDPRRNVTACCARFTVVLPCSPSDREIVP